MLHAYNSFPNLQSTILAPLYDIIYPLFSDKHNLSAIFLIP